MKTYYLTTPIYYMNGTPHLGHYYATTITDALARFHRMRNRKVFFLTGTDEHGEKVAKKAQEVGKTPQEFTNELSLVWQQSWQKLDISYDFFIRTTDPYHKAFVGKVISILKDKGAIYEREYESLYCVGAEAFVTKSELREGGLCPDHDEQPQIIREKNWFFRLSQYKSQLEDLIRQDSIRIMPEVRKNEALELLGNDGVTDFSVTRSKANVSWGIPVPFDNDQTVYVWIDALFNYMTALGAFQHMPLEDLTVESIGQILEGLWPPDVHILGKDILKFHAIYWPAFLLALGVPPSRLPRTLLVHGMFISSGRKMSKSLGNTVIPEEIVRYFDEVIGEPRGNDVLRYFVLSEMKIGNDGDITIERVKEVYQSKLVNKLGNTFSRVAGMARKYGVDYKSDVQTTTESLLSTHLEKYMTDYDTHGYIEAIMDSIEEVGKQIEMYKPWELFKQSRHDELRTHLSAWLDTLNTLSDALEPVMPRTRIAMKTVLQGEDGQVFPRIMEVA